MAWLDDEEEDDLQRLLEGRDYDDEDQFFEEFVQFKESVERKSSQTIVSKVVTTKTTTEIDNVSEEDEDEEFEENNGKPADDEAKEVPAVKPKIKRHFVRNPRPTLNEDRLKTERGIVALPKYFDRVKFKGKGHEKDDLNRLMLGLEHWANRLMPSLSFDDFIEKCEFLGHKRKIQTFMTKLRLDLPLDTIVEKKEVGDDDERPFEDLIEEEPERIDPEVAFDKILEDDLLKEKLTTKETSQKELENVTPKPTLTDEQLKIIEEKRLKAIELRQKRLEKFDPNYGIKDNSNTDAVGMTNTSNRDEQFCSQNDLDVGMH